MSSLFHLPQYFKVKKVSHSVIVWLFVTPWTVACQAPLSMEFSRQEYWSGLPLPSPEEFPNPGTEPRSPTLQADSLLYEPLGKEREIESESRSVISDSLQPHGLHSLWNSSGQNTGVGSLSLLQGICPIQESNWSLLHCRQITNWAIKVAPREIDPPPNSGWHN